MARSKMCSEGRYHRNHRSDRSRYLLLPQILRQIKVEVIKYLRKGKGTWPEVFRSPLVPICLRPINLPDLSTITTRQETAQHSKSPLFLRLNHATSSDTLSWLFPRSKTSPPKPRFRADHRRYYTSPHRTRPCASFAPSYYAD